MIKSLLKLNKRTTSGLNETQLSRIQGRRVCGCGDATQHVLDLLWPGREDTEIGRSVTHREIYLIFDLYDKGNNRSYLIHNNELLKLYGNWIHNYDERFSIHLRLTSNRQALDLLITKQLIYRMTTALRSWILTVRVGLDLSIPPLKILDNLFWTHFRRSNHIDIFVNRIDNHEYQFTKRTFDDRLSTGFEHFCVHGCWPVNRHLSVAEHYFFTENVWDHTRI